MTSERQDRVWRKSQGEGEIHHKQFSNLLYFRQNDIWYFDAKTEEFTQITPVEGKAPPKISRISLECFDGLVCLGCDLSYQRKTPNATFIRSSDFFLGLLLRWHFTRKNKNQYGFHF